MSAGIVYGTRNGRPLTMDVIRPAMVDGSGLLVIVSDSRASFPSKFRIWMAAPFLPHGQTVFAISHVSQPVASDMEIVDGMYKAARFVRLHG